MRSTESVSDFILETPRHLLFVRVVKSSLRSLLLKTSTSEENFNKRLPLILWYCDLYPEATYSNIKRHSARVLLGISERFFEAGLAGDEVRFWKLLWNLLICETEHDSFYGHRFEWLVEELRKAGAVNGISYARIVSIRNKFFEYERNMRSARLFKAVWKIALERFPLYKEIIPWFITQIGNSDWKPRVPTRPSRDGWSEPVRERSD